MLYGPQSPFTFSAMTQESPPSPSSGEYRHPEPYADEEISLLELVDVLLGR